MRTESLLVLLLFIYLLWLEKMTTATTTTNRKGSVLVLCRMDFENMVLEPPQFLFCCSIQVSSLVSLILPLLVVINEC